MASIVLVITWSLLTKPAQNESIQITLQFFVLRTSVCGIFQRFLQVEDLSFFLTIIQYNSMLPLIIWSYGLNCILFLFVWCSVCSTFINRKKKNTLFAKKTAYEFVSEKKVNRNYVYLVSSAPRKMKSIWSKPIKALIKIRKKKLKQNSQQRKSISKFTKYEQNDNFLF